MKISGKHSVEEINGIRCSVVEKQANAERVNFIRAILEHNGYEVLAQKNVPPPSKALKPGIPPSPPNVSIPDSYKIGVRDIRFNLPVMIFGKVLKTLENNVLLPVYWNQESADFNDWYWKWNFR